MRLVRWERQWRSKMRRGWQWQLIKSFLSEHPHPMGDRSERCVVSRHYLHQTLFRLIENNPLVERLLQGGLSERSSYQTNGSSNQMDGSSTVLPRSLSPFFVTESQSGAAVAFCALSTTLTHFNYKNVFLSLSLIWLVSSQKSCVSVWVLLQRQDVVHKQTSGSYIFLWITVFRGLAPQEGKSIPWDGLWLHFDYSIDLGYGNVRLIKET